MAKIICIDPGHGGVQPGAVNGSRKEKDDVLKMALAVQKLLAKQGVKVVMTRTSDKDVEIMDRCAIANNADADYFISIHRNSGGGTGHEAWVLSSATSATTAKAKTIVDNICKVDGKNRGVKKGAVSYSDYGVNKYSNMPSCLLELGFIDSSADNKSFDKHFDAFALAIAKGLCAAVGVTYKTNTATEDDETMKKGDINEGVLALKCMLIQLKELGKISVSLNYDHGFGDGTYNAVKQVQKLSGLSQTGVADEKTIRACKTLITNEFSALKKKISNAQAALK